MTGRQMLLPLAGTGNLWAVSRDWEHRSLLADQVEEVLDGMAHEMGLELNVVGEARQDPEAETQDLREDSWVSAPKAVH